MRHAFAALGARLVQWKAAICGVPDATTSGGLKAELLKLKFNRASALIPLLYLTVAINAAAGALAAHGDFSIIYRLILPGILITFAAIRYLAWRSRKDENASPARIRRHLRNITIIALGLSLLGGLWAVSAYYETHETRRILAAIFVLLSAFATATCLISLPFAAAGSVILALGPITFAMLFSSDLGLKAVGISYTVAIFLIVRLVIANSSDMISGLRARLELQHLAETDALTGASNRRAFKKAVGAEIARDGAEFTIFLLDLDGFKSANDRFGHEAGDAILVEVVSRLRIICPDACSIARLGGDEFAVLQPMNRDGNMAEDFTLAISKSLALPYIIDQNMVMISASVGKAAYPEGGAQLADLLRQADHELYKCKSQIAAKDRSDTGERRKFRPS
ncbi:MAG: diguanylate cyclase [Sphingorhabdus sp.]